MDTPWRIELLGWLRASQGARIISRFRSQKAASLLAYLAFYRDRSHPRGKLVELLWPEHPPEAGQRNLRVELASLRRQLEPPGIPVGTVIMADRAAVQLNPGAATTDVAQFEAGLRAANTAAGAEQVRRLTAALELYLGELLPGFYEAWVLPERQRLASLYLHALRQISRLHESTGDLAQAIRWAGQATAADPQSEEARYELIRLLALDGQREAALRQFQEFEEALRPLGTAPAAETRALAQQITDREQGSAEALPVIEANRTGSPPHAVTSASHLSPAALPSGTVTFWLTDIEVSTARFEKWGDAYVLAREGHDQLLRQLIQAHGGHEVKYLGDGFLVAFQRAESALACAMAAQHALAAHAWPERVGRLPVRMALYRCYVEPKELDYHAIELHYADRVVKAGHGGQILCPEETARLLRGNLEPGVELVDLGSYRLRGVTKPARLFQISYPGMTPAAFPPLRVPRAIPGYLPLQFTRFIGREEEIARLREMLSPRDEEQPGRSHPSSLPGPGPRRGPLRGANAPPPSHPSRLITLTGPGGTGKTRLAQEVARSLWEPYHEAVWFVNLIDLVDPRLIAERVLEALGLPRSPEIPPLDQVIAALSNQPSLLLLDNFEQLVHGGAPIVQTLMERVPGVALLATSRRRLHLTGEREIRVRPLPVPALRDEGYTRSAGTRMRDEPTPGGLSSLIPHPSSLLGCASVELFVDRAQAVDADFQVTPGNAAAVAALCDKLEGLPLAIELAAAWAGVLTPAQMLGQLSRRLEFLVSQQKDVTPRHRSMRLACAWSYQLLSPELRRCFARLSVFRGGWTLAAAAVAEDTAASEPGLALEHLSQLLAYSLIVAEATDARYAPAEAAKAGSASTSRGFAPEEAAWPAGEPEMRYRFQEIVRQYAAEQLSPEEQASVSRRHAEYCLTLAESGGRDPTGAALREWLDRLEQEHDNMRAALDWAAASREAELGLRLGEALWYFWEVRGYRTEGRERLTELLAQVSGTLAEGRDPYLSALQAGALRGLGVLAYFQGDHGAARAALDEGLNIARALDDKRMIADLLRRIADVAAMRADYQAARAMCEEALEIRKELGDRRGIRTLLSGLSWIAREEGDLDTARALGEQSLAISRELNSDSGLVYSLASMGETCYLQGDLPAAGVYLKDSLKAFEELGDKGGVGWVLGMLGVVAELRGDYGEAQALQEQSLVIRRELEDKGAIADSLNNLGHLARHRGDAWRAVALSREGLSLAWKQGNKRRIAECLEGLAAALLSETGGESALRGAAASVRSPEAAATGAARLFGAALSLRQKIGSPLPPVFRPDHDRGLAAVRAVLGEAAFASAWAEGQAMPLDEAIAHALEGGW